MNLVDLYSIYTPLHSLYLVYIISPHLSLSLLIPPNLSTDLSTRNVNNILSLIHSSYPKTLHISTPIKNTINLTPKSSFPLHPTHFPLTTFNLPDLLYLLCLKQINLHPLTLSSPTTLHLLSKPNKTSSKPSQININITIYS